MSTSDPKKCPYDTAGFFSRITYMWLLPLVMKGRRDGINESDLFNCSREDSSDKVGQKLQREWDKELRRYESGKNPSLTRAILRVFAKPYLLASILPFIEECGLKISQAVSLGYLVRAFGSSQGGIPNAAYYSAAGVCLTSILVLFTRHPFFIAVRKIGMQVRVACCAVVCRKELTPYNLAIGTFVIQWLISPMTTFMALKLSKAAMGETTVGQMVNLISNDVARFDQAVLFLPYLVIGPIQTAIIVTILWKDLGPSCIAGVSVLLLYIPYQIFIGRVLTGIRCKTALKTDERICVTSEVVAGMKIIKMYCWENAFKAMVQRARKFEIRYLHGASLIQFLNTALSLVFSKIILVICFVLYSYLGHRLTAEKVFVSLALFNHLRMCMTFYFANGITQLAETAASIKRLQTFLLLEEQQEMDKVERPQCRPLLQNCSVSIDKIYARWDCTVENMTLESITGKVRPGELLAIVGPVGSGKTSLLMALMGELQAEKGRIRVSGNIAYTSQEPWTFSGTVRQNIVFDKSFEIVKYRKVIQASALEKDIEQFEKGDLTLVGDRGASLSGGQRARISLARALYADSDVYLLDDPLSAVDAAVGKQLFENCICGFLKNKVRVLVTHQVQFLKAANHILVLNQGKMVGLGNYGALVKLGVDLLTIEDEVKEERRNSVCLKGRRQSISHRASMTHRKSSIAQTPTSNTGNRRSSVILSGLRNSVKNPGRDVNTTHQESRKKSVVASLFEGRRFSSIKNGGRDRQMSIGSTVMEEEEVFTPGNAIEILPFGGIVDSSSELVLDEDSDESPQRPEEATGSGSVSFASYWKYQKATGSVLGVLIFILVSFIRQVGVNGSDYWLTLWTNENECNRQTSKNRSECYPLITKIVNESCNHVYIEFRRILHCDFQIWYPDIFRDGYIVLVGGILALAFTNAVIYSFLVKRASINLHERMFQSILRSKVSFFDENPVGRILNRFSRDMGTVDETLPVILSESSAILLNLLGSVILVIIINPFIAIPTSILAVIFTLVRGVFVGPTRDIKRIEAVTRSPVFSALATAMNGITVIRAFRSQVMFEKQFSKAQDNHTAAWFAFICISQYFGMVLDFLCAIYITAITWVLVLLSAGTSAGNIGLAVSSALVLSGTFQWGVRLSVEVENQVIKMAAYFTEKMTSVERIVEYSKLPSEGATESAPDKKPPDDWPQKGNIDFSGISLRYTPEGKYILRNFNCAVKAEEKVGIVGRTGAGKSSLMAGLYRMVEPEGSIYIDGLATKDIGLHDLRSKISIIPQEPLIFTGSVRNNLDPFDEYSDPEIWESLERVHLKDVVRGLPKQIYCQLAEGGAQFSLGQRQLFCLARAILRKNKILVMDEATANIDHNTDALIQKLIKEVFRDCTVLTIAHRINTIIDYNKILVLDSGVAAEYDEPHVLLQMNGMFADMVRQTGWAMQKELSALALAAHKRYQAASSIDKSAVVFDSTHQEEQESEAETPLRRAVLTRMMSNLSSEQVIEESEEENGSSTAEEGETKKEDDEEVAKAFHTRL